MLYHDVYSNVYVSCFWYYLLGEEDTKVIRSRARQRRCVLLAQRQPRRTPPSPPPPPPPPAPSSPARYIAV
ncbi:hypothetical protein Y032_0515g2779 [Ancylostoma ceylanicum]|uniref:Uncharacterized protein n=1 Tax=Ancylostoma ceylanicum TaxID=53326 RepID=A0A016WT54_9BILA|nr:hypothetical protein Y032_0515g2779 [Ancylostoma ceylanicum]